MRFIFFLLLLAGTILSCKNTNPENEITETRFEADAVYGDADYGFPELSLPAKEQAIHWGILEDLLSTTKKINGGSYQDIKNGSELLTQYSDSLFAKIPDTLNINPIHSRLMVLKTRAALLYQNFHRENMDSTGLQQSVSEMNLAVKNLIVQLNEKFQKDKIDLQRIDNEKRELKGKQSFRDSIMELERKDQKRG